MNQFTNQEDQSLDFEANSCDQGRKTRRITGIYSIDNIIQAFCPIIINATKEEIAIIRRIIIDSIFKIDTINPTIPAVDIPREIFKAIIAESNIQQTGSITDAIVNNKEITDFIAGIAGIAKDNNITTIEEFSAYVEQDIAEFTGIIESENIEEDIIIQN